MVNKMKYLLIFALAATLACRQVVQDKPEPDPVPVPPAGPLEPPSQLTCEASADGVLLKWKDCSDGEEGFVVVRMGAHSSEEFFVKKNKESFTDTGVRHGRFTYRVHSYVGLDRSEPAECQYENMSAPQIGTSAVQTSWYMVSLPLVITDDGGEPCDAGVCWSESGDPTIEDNVHVFNGKVESGAECYGNATGLEYGKVYKLRAWARNSMGIVYSRTLSSSLSAAPAVFKPEWEQMNIESLPSSVQLYKTETSVTGRKVNAWYAIADMTAGDVELRTMKASKLMTASSFATEVMKDDQLCVIVNGGYFDASAQSFSFVMDRGQKQSENIRSLTRTTSYTVTRGAFGVDERGRSSVKWIYHGTGLWAYDKALPVVDGEKALAPSATYPCTAQEWNVWSAIGGAPVLLKDGKICFDYLKTSSGKYKTNYELLQSDIFGETVRPPRTAIGRTADNRIVLMVVDGRMSGGSYGVTLDELAGLLLGVGCVDALNLDGGGSSTMCAGKDAVLLNNPSDGAQRKVLSFVSIVKK